MIFKNKHNLKETQNQKVDNTNTLNKTTPKDKLKNNGKKLFKDSSNNELDNKKNINNKTKNLKGDKKQSPNIESLDFLNASVEENALPDKSKEEKKIIIKEPRIIEKKKKLKEVKKLSKSQTCLRYNPNINSGLTSKQVESRVLDGLDNKVFNKNNKTILGILITNIFTFFNLLCFLVAAALILVGAWSNCLYMVIVLANLAIGIFQEIKSKLTVDKINLVTSPKAKVLRNGAESIIKIEEVVLDDIIIFTTGNQICADCVVSSGEVEANESLLTGESVPVKKRKGDILLSGSFIVSGTCYARVDKVGNESYTSELSLKAKQFKKQKSELLKSLKIIITIIGIIIIPLSIVMYYNNFSNTLSTIDAVKQTAGSVIGMIPAGMFLLTSVALAAGVIKLAKKRTLVQDLYSIEMLARADILCLDKTGTITDGTMKVTDTILIDTAYANNFRDIVGSLLTALDDNNMTSRALVSHFGYSKEYIAKTILPFNSTRKMSGATFKNNETFIMGAPEYLLKTNKNTQINDIIKIHISKGFRVLILCKCKGVIVEDKISDDVTPIAIIVIEDHIRDDAQKTIEWFKTNGVQIKIISGDNAVTVSEVSKRVGVENADRFISLDGLSEQQVIEAANKYTVFGRVSPEQKCILIKALKSKGHKVAMTGDGVNDILALKEADCSIAMASGSDATRHVSNLVLLDSNFSSMPSVVSEGRRVINNVQNSSSLFLMKTIFTIITSIICLITQIVYPFTTLHVILLETCVIGIPSFFLALQPNTDQIKGKFLPNLLSKSLPGAILFVINVVACYLFAHFVPAIADYTILASLSITLTGLLVLFKLCQPINVYRGIMFSATTLLCIISLFFIPLSFFYGIMAPEHISLIEILFIAVIVQASYPIYSTIVRICDKLITIKKED